MAMLSRSPQDTAAIAREFARNLEPHADTAEGKARATVIALSGELGAGKTTFTKAFAEALGVSADEVTSPTFVIQKSFDLGGRVGFRKLVHIDAYRLEKPEEIERLGWRELLADPANLILVEWPEHIGDALPSDAQRISFSYKSEDERDISFA